MSASECLLNVFKSKYVWINYGELVGKEFSWFQAVSYLSPKRLRGMEIFSANGAQAVTGGLE